MARRPACPGKEVWIRGVPAVPGAQLCAEWLSPLPLCSGAVEETPSCLLCTLGVMSVCEPRTIAGQEEDMRRFFSLEL